MQKIFIKAIILNQYIFSLDYLSLTTQKVLLIFQIIFKNCLQQ